MFQWIGPFNLFFSNKQSFDLATNKTPIYVNSFYSAYKESMTFTCDRLIELIGRCREKLSSSRERWSHCDLHLHKCGWEHPKESLKQA